jgi:hypothetical protein
MRRSGPCSAEMPRRWTARRHGLARVLGDIMLESLYHSQSSRYNALFLKPLSSFEYILSIENNTFSWEVVNLRNATWQPGLAPFGDGPPNPRGHQYGNIVVSRNQYQTSPFVVFSALCTLNWPLDALSDCIRSFIRGHEHWRHKHPLTSTTRFNFTSLLRSALDQRKRSLTFLRMILRPK